MDFYEVLDQVIALLQSRGRVTYNALKRQFEVDDAFIADLRDEIIEAQQLAIDENDRLLVWAGNPTTVSAQAPKPNEAQRDLLAYTPPHLADIFLAQGDLVQAQEFLDGVYRLVKDPTTSEMMKWRYSTHLFASLGEMWLARGDPASTQEFVDQCLDIATRTNSRKNLV